MREIRDALARLQIVIAVFKPAHLDCRGKLILADLIFRAELVARSLTDQCWGLQVFQVFSTKFLRLPNWVERVANTEQTSDAIRLKWAYQLGLLELSSVEATNHPGMLLFDEPRQQSSAKVSFESLLTRAASAKQRNHQVIFSTSEELQNLQRITADLDCEVLIYPEYIIQPIS